MIVLRREIARQAADLFGEAHEHVGEVIVLSAGDRDYFDFCAVWQFGVARKNYYAIFDCAFVAYGRKITVCVRVCQPRFDLAALRCLVTEKSAKAETL